MSLPSGLGLTLAVWAAGGAVLGLAAGLTSHGLGGSGSITTWGAVAAGIGAGVGVLGLQLERAMIAPRLPAIQDARGRPLRPVHGLLLGLPLVLASAGLLWLGLLIPLATGSQAGLMLCWVGAVGLLWAADRVRARHHLGRALQERLAGRSEQARARLRRLARRSPAWIKGTAQLELGRLDLAEGDLPGAREAFIGARVLRPAQAAAGLALTYALLDDPVLAHDALADALSSPGSEAVRPELDGLRVLLVWRQEGPVEAQALGEALVGPGCHSLLLGLVGQLRRRAGDLSGAHQLLDGGAEEVLRRAGLWELLAELGADSA